MIFEPHVVPAGLYGKTDSIAAVDTWHAASLQWQGIDTTLTGLACSPARENVHHRRRAQHNGHIAG
ncbi:MAG: hypothetical protein LBR08_10300 [Bacteroidales bacterium]|nr:hypothetical protein [Bacteroidales bacterium]